MAIIEVTGRIGSINAAGTLYVIWESVPLKNGSTMKRLWKLWGDASLELSENDTVTVRGEWSESPSTNINGEIETYVNAKGQTVTRMDLMINDAEVLNRVPSVSKTYESAGIDQDDVRKYGTAQNNDLLPF